MRSFWRDFFGLDGVHLPKGSLLSEDIKAFGAMEFPDIKPLKLPAIKTLAGKVAKSRKEAKRAQKPVLQMRRKA